MLLALGAMFLQQTFASLGRSLPTVIAPAIISDLRLDAAWVGVYVSLIAVSALIFQLGCGSFIIRYGALRMSQVALVLLAGGLSAASTGWIFLFALSAAIGGGGAAISTPASSHLLGRYSPPSYAPLVFSLKQTAVPAGLLMAGLLGPALTQSVGWSTTLNIAAAGCVLFAFMLQRLRPEFDADRVPSRQFRFSDFRTTFTSVLATTDLRNLSMACFAFNGLQTVFTSYFIIYLFELGYDLALAGLVFSVAMFMAVPCRILWGWLGSTSISPRSMMGGLAFGMAGSTLLVGLFGPLWPVLIVGFVASCLSATAMSWHGVLLAEAARLAPAGMRGMATGGVLSFGQLGGLLLPLAYSGLLFITESHGIGFMVCGAPALLVGTLLMRRSAQGDASPPRQS
ncbi:MFS transporter [Plastoroseomonas hellenica]|uniref:MFS transporter n=1 Tax=Plastoroseomonas hellenica TaxID=2687306 RepID=UPI001BAB2829|nr:MFS transporter [Plastoroseomonas hellenica]MBR0641348.1 MFS transporter [Plastoroseomonas hellenica]